MANISISELNFSAFDARISDLDRSEQSKTHGGHIRFEFGDGNNYTLDNGVAELTTIDLRNSGFSGAAIQEAMAEYYMLNPGSWQ